MYSQGTGRRGSNESYSSDVSIKAIVPDSARHNCTEKIAIVFDHRLNVQKSREAFVVEFAGSAGKVQVPATLANSSTLILDTPEYKMACVVTIYVYHGNRLLGQHKFEFLSKSDSFYRLLYGALDPVSFMCEALQISPKGTRELDNALAVTFQSNAAHGFEFLGIHHKDIRGKSDAEHPTLLHFACEYGLTELVQVLLSYPGAREACSIKNRNNQRPYNIAENHGFLEMANELRTFQDQGHSDGYIKMRMAKGNEEDLYVRMPQPDGSYCFILRNSDIYTDIEGGMENEDEDYYVKMRDQDGHFYFLQKKDGACIKPTQITNKQVSTTDQRQSEPHGADVYENLGSDNQFSGEHNDQELYEDMASGKHEEFYEDMAHDVRTYDDVTRKETMSSDELYVTMQSGESGDLQSFCMTEQTPDKHGYVKPRPNQLFDAEMFTAFNRSASSAAAVRAKQLETLGKKSKTLPPPGATDTMTLMQSMFDERVKSGNLSEMEARKMMDKLGLLPNQGIIHRSGSTSSRSSSATTSSTSSGISLSSEPEVGFPDDADPGDEDIHQNPSDILSELMRSSIKPSNSSPPPLPPQDYEVKGKPPGRPQKSRPHWRSQTAPVEEKDVHGLLNPESSQPSPAPRGVQRRQSSPSGGTFSDFQSKESRGSGQPIAEFVEQEPTAAHHPSPRRPLPKPSAEETNPALPPPLAERMRPIGVSILPPQRVQDSAPPPVVPRKAPMPPSRSPR